MNENKENIEMLVDKGWQNMSKILDNKMPVVSKQVFFSRKRVLLLVLLLTFVSTAGVYYFTTPSNTKTENNTPIEDQAQTTNYNIAQINVSSNLEEEANKSELKQDKSNDDFTNNSITNVDNKTNSIKNGIEKSLTSNIKTKGNNFKNAIINSSINKEINNQISSTIDENVKFSPNNLKNTTVREYALIDKLVTKIPTLQFIYSLNPEFEIQPLFHHLPNLDCSNNNFQLTLNAVSENFISLGGVESGLLYKFGIGKNIGLVTGIELSFFAKQGMQNSFFSTYNLSDPFVNGYTENSNEETQSNNIDFNENFRSPGLMSRFIDKLYYFGIPMSISYSKNKYSLLAGIKISYMFHGTDYTINKGEVGGHNVVILSPTAFYNGNVYNKIDYSFVLSFDYYLTNKLALTSKINYAYSGIINSPEIQIDPRQERFAVARSFDQIKDRYDKNVYFGLGLKYVFGKRCNND